jgi:hypothetical protein
MDHLFGTDRWASEASSSPNASRAISAACVRKRHQREMNGMFSFVVVMITHGGHYRM